MKRRNERDRGHQVLGKKGATPIPSNEKELFDNPIVLGIDPGLKGAFVLFDGAEFLEIFLMPVVKTDKENRVNFCRILEWLEAVKKDLGVVPVFLERAKPLAMGSKFAFNYGRDFEKIVLAIHLAGLKKRLRQIEPSVWTKVMHEGLDPDLKPKAKSLKALHKLYPQLVAWMPQKPRGGIQDGPIDAFLIAAYALGLQDEVIADFY